jgi:hypothetical protein
MRRAISAQWAGASGGAGAGRRGRPRPRRRRHQPRRGAGGRPPTSAGTVSASVLSSHVRSLPRPACRGWRKPGAPPRCAVAGRSRGRVGPCGAGPARGSVGAAVGDHARDGRGDRATARAAAASGCRCAPPRPARG